MTTDTIEKMSQRRTRAGIVVWDGPRPKDDDEYDEQFWDKLRDSLASIHLDFRPITGVLCHCGCLLRDEHETCPACLAWALRDAVAASWRAATAYYSDHERKAA